MYDVIVIGIGLIGSAATRYLSEADMNVAGLGPAEPQNWKEHNGVFASHYDQGRITRIIDPTHFWGRAGKRAIDAYADIEARSGVRFHHPVGCLRLTAQPDDPADSLRNSEKIGASFGARYEELDEQRLERTFPFFDFPKQSVALWETGNAGYINPRSLVEAQLTIAKEHDATIIRQTAISLKSVDDGWQATTAEGDTHSAKRLLIAAGAYTNTLIKPLLGQRLDMRPRLATIMLAKLDEAEAERLADMPTIIYRLPEHDHLYSIYCLPPVRYPDGKMYIKLGGTPRNLMHTPVEQDDITGALIPWFHGDGDTERAGALRDILNNTIPSLEAQSYHSRPCVTTYTSDDHAYIGALDEGLYVAAGGCGAAAKSSNELGRVGALLAEHDAWVYDVNAAEFAPRLV